MSHEKRGISRNPMEGRCGNEFLKRRNKKTIWKVNQESAGPEVAAGWPGLCKEPHSRWLLSPNAGLTTPDVSNSTIQSSVPGKSTFLRLSSTSPGACNEGCSTSRFSPWAEPNSETLLRTWVSHLVPQVGFPSAPAASSSSCSFEVLLLLLNWAPEPMALKAIQSQGS